MATETLVPTTAWLPTIGRASTSVFDDAAAVGATTDSTSIWLDLIFGDHFLIYTPTLSLTGTLTEVVSLTGGLFD